MVYNRPSIFIVDDAHAICEILSTKLTERGYQCTAAYDGASALTKLKTARFDVVLLDVRLPDMSGIEVLAKIRTGYPATETIMVTVINDAKSAVDAMKLGALDYLIKPVNLDTLDAKIRTILKMKRLSEEAGQNEPYPSLSRTPWYDRYGNDKSLDMVNAIARGVAARYDSFLEYSKMLMFETTEIARRLGFDETIIQQWLTMNSAQHSAEKEVIESGLDKLKHSFLTQEVLGMAPEYKPPNESNSSRN